MIENYNIYIFQKYIMGHRGIVAQFPIDEFCCPFIWFDLFLHNHWLREEAMTSENNHDYKLESLLI